MMKLSTRLRRHAEAILARSSTQQSVCLVGAWAEEVEHMERRIAHGDRLITSLVEALRLFEAESNAATPPNSTP